MPLLHHKQIIEFSLGREQYKVIETQASPEVTLMTVISMKEKWYWKEDVMKLESDVIQFSGKSPEDAFNQCDEWIKITTSKSLRMILALKTN